MKIVDRVKSAIVRRLTIREPDGWTPQGAMSDAGEGVTEHSVLALSGVWACTNLIAGTIGTLPLEVQRKSAGRREPFDGHPLYSLLHDSPNYDQTSVDFWEFCAAGLELWGNAYARIERNSAGRVAALVPVNPALMQVRRLADGRLEYRWTESGRQHVRTEEAVLHIRGFGGEPLGGMSTLQFGRQAFGLARAIDKSAGSTFRNGMRPSGALTFKDYPGQTSAEKAAEAEAQLQAKHQGAINSGTPMILYGGATWQPFTINPEDAQMLESRRFSIEEICRFFGVPPHMVGHTEKSTSWGTGLEQQTLAFQKFTLRRRLKRIEMALEKQLLTPADRANGVRISFNVEGLLRGDSAGRARFYQTMTAMGAMTINEVRAQEGLPPVPGGDVPRIQMQNQPIAEAGNG